MSLTGMDCEVKSTCANMNILGLRSANMKHCNNNFDPEVQIEHSQQSAMFTWTRNNQNCGTVSTATCAPETTMATVTTSVPYCETTHTTHSCEITSFTNLLFMPRAHVLKPYGSRFAYLSVTQIFRRSQKKKTTAGECNRGTIRQYLKLT